MSEPIISGDVAAYIHPRIGRKVKVSGELRIRFTDIDISVPSDMSDDEAIEYLQEGMDFDDILNLGNYDLEIDDIETVTDEVVV